MRERERVLARSLVLARVLVLVPWSTLAKSLWLAVVLAPLLSSACAWPTVAYTRLAVWRLWTHTQASG